MNNADIKNGIQYEYSNDDYTLSFWYEQITSWDYPYKVLFNGAVYTYKSFQSALNRVNKLIALYELKQGETE